MNRMRVLSVSTDRADLGIVAPVWRALEQRAEFDHHVLLTGSWATNSDLARASVPDGAVVHVAGVPLAGGEPDAILAAMHKISVGAGEIIGRVRPDLLLVAGDRLDMFPVVTASVPFNLPVAHIAGGDLSYGAIDDRLRHAVTKLAHVHFVLNEKSAARVHAMGEESWRIVVSGAPNLDTLVAMPVLTAAEFAAEVGLACVEGLRLVTIHPETNSADHAGPMRAVLAALADDERPLLVTAPNQDPGGSQMRIEVATFAQGRSRAVYRETLGARLYANALRLASVMIGNSSSGIIEAGLFGLPVVDVGARQDGRDAGPNVIHCAATEGDVRRAMAKAEGLGRLGTASSLYGDGQAARRIVAALARLPDRQALLYKRFETEPIAFQVPWG